MKSSATKRFKSNPYIPKFILKNFCFEGNKINCYSKKENKVTIKDIDEAFKDYFLEAFDGYDWPLLLSLGDGIKKYEKEMYSLFKNKILNKKKRIVLTKAEIDSIKYFFALISFRTKLNVGDFLAFSKESKSWFTWWRDNDYDDYTGGFWLRHLSRIYQCRSLKEMLNNDKIAEPFKVYFKLKTEGLFGTYLSFMTKSFPESCFEFYIGENYPTFIPSKLNPDFVILGIIPISPELLILLISKGDEKSRVFEEDIIKDAKDLFMEPTYDDDNDTYIHIIKNIKHAYNDLMAEIDIRNDFNYFKNRYEHILWTVNE